MSRWRERGWKVALYASLLGAMWLLLTPRPPQVAPDATFVDKLEHVVLFAALALIAARAYQDRPRWGIVVALTIFGLCMEIAQPRTGRTYDLLDALADGIGSMAVYLAPRPRVQQRSS